VTGEDVDDDTLMNLFEADSWTSFSFKNQPRIFIYTKRTGSEWIKFLDLLNERTECGLGMILL